MTPGEDFLVALDALLGTAGPGGEATDLPTTAGPTRITSWGPRGGRPVVLLPGYGATAGAWVRVVPHLAQRHRVHAVDLVGDAGRSVPDRPPRRPDDLHRWLDEVLAWAGGGGRVGLVGHSYGAWLAASATLAGSPHVASLTLLDPTDCFGRFSVRYLVRAVPLLVRPTPARWRSFLAWEAGAAPVDEEWARVAGLATLLPGSPVVRPRRPTLEQWRTLDRPTLVLVAERSRAHAAAAVAEAAAGVPRVTVGTLRGASHHSVPGSHAEEIGRAVLRHLADADA